MDIERFGRPDEGGVEIAVLDAVATASKEVTGAAIVAGWASYALRNVRPVRRVVGFFVSLEHDPFLLAGVVGIGNILGGVACSLGELFVGAGLFMTDQTIDFLL